MNLFLLVQILKIAPAASGTQMLKICHFHQKKVLKRNIMEDMAVVTFVVSR